MESIYVAMKRQLTLIPMNSIEPSIYQLHRYNTIIRDPKVGLFRSNRYVLNINNMVDSIITPTVGSEKYVYF